MSRPITPGAVNQSSRVLMLNSTTGAPVLGLDESSPGLSLSYHRTGAAVVAITPVALASLTTAHADGGFKEVGEGWYRVDLPDAAVGVGADDLELLAGATGAVSPGAEHPLTTLAISVSVGTMTAAVQPGNRLSTPMLLDMGTTEAKTLSIALKDANGADLDLTGKTLRFVVQDIAGVGVFDVEDAGITVTGASNNIADVAVTVAQSASEMRNHHWWLWDVTTLNGEFILAHGPFNIKKAVKNV